MNNKSQEFQLQLVEEFEKVLQAGGYAYQREVTEGTHQILLRIFARESENSDWECVEVLDALSISVSDIFRFAYMQGKQEGVLLGRKTYQLEARRFLGFKD